MAPPGTPFGGLLRHYRLQAGLSQKALGEAVGFSQAVISWLETGIWRPNKGRALAIIEVINRHLPEASRVDPDDWMTAWREVDKFVGYRQEELQQMAEERKKRVTIGSRKDSNEIQFLVAASLPESSMGQLDKLINAHYTTRSQVMRELLLLALQDKEIVKKIKRGGNAKT